MDVLLRDGQVAEVALPEKFEAQRTTSSTRAG